MITKFVAQINMDKKWEEKEELTFLKKELEQYIRTAKKFNFPSGMVQKQIDLYLDDINQVLKKLKERGE